MTMAEKSCTGCTDRVILHNINDTVTAGYEASGAVEGNLTERLTAYKYKSETNILKKNCMLSSICTQLLFIMENCVTILIM